MASPNIRTGCRGHPQGLSPAASQAWVRPASESGCSEGCPGSPCFRSWALGLLVSQAPGLAPAGGLCCSSCQGETGREAPPLTAPRETLMPGHRTAISWHLGPKPQPQSPTAACRWAGLRLLTKRGDPKGLTHRTGASSQGPSSSRLRLGAWGNQEPVRTLGFPHEASLPGYLAMGNTGEESPADGTQSPSSPAHLPTATSQGEANKATCMASPPVPGQRRATAGGHAGWELD